MPAKEHRISAVKEYSRILFPVNMELDNGYASGVHYGY